MEDHMTEGLFSKLLADTFRKSVAGLGWLGVFFIVYSANAEFNGHQFPFLEKWGPPLSICLTIVGTLLTAVSIYFYKEHNMPHRPEAFSRFVAAPIVICCCMLALWFLATRGDLPVMLTNGFAMLGLAGALYRVQLNPGLVQ
jgi:uncharacterized membrane protein YdcZ (DUF606 family)